MKLFRSFDVDIEALPIGTPLFSINPFPHFTAERVSSTHCETMIFSPPWVFKVAFFSMPSFFESFTILFIEHFIAGLIGFNQVLPLFSVWYVSRVEFTDVSVHEEREEIVVEVSGESSR